MRPEDVVGAVLRGVLVSRHKRTAKTLRRLGHGHLLSTRNILAAAAAAWGLYEAMQNSSRSGEAGAASATLPPAGPLPPPPPTPRVGAGEAASGPPPLPSPSGAAPPAPADPGIPSDVARLVRLLIAAARADGDLKPEEGALIARHAGEAGAEDLVRAELQRHPTLAEVVGTVKEPAAAAELYSVAFAVLRADEDVNGTNGAGSVSSKGCSASTRPRHDASRKPWRRGSTWTTRARRP